MPKKAQPLFMSPRTDLELSLQLKRHSGIALHVQLANQLRDAICSGRLEAGSRIPSSRQLARLLKIDRNIVLIAFETLLSEGYLLAKLGSGTFVTSERLSPQIQAHYQKHIAHRWVKPVKLEVPNESLLEKNTITFALGQPSVTELDMAAWRGIWRNVASTVPSRDYPDPQGHVRLREALAQYLGRSRGLRCTATDVIITNGITQTIQMISRATLKPKDTVAIEEPGYRLVRDVFQSLKVRIKAIPVDQDGLEVDRLPTGDAAPILVYCTPSHQYPLGSRLSVPRRLALLEWARNHDSLILEDDYDGEFRFETAPLPALAALGQDCTVYLGTFSKTIAPSLRVGYLVAPPALLERLVQLKTLNDYDTSLPMQIALVKFIESGHFERHIRRMRRVYANKRQTLLERLAPIQHIASLKGLEAGLHAHLELPESMKAEQIVVKAGSVGVNVSTLESYYLERPTVNGLLLGYGGLTIPEIQTGARKLVQIILEQH
jgi:GntR family transcriptional regulator/MocR family aminotransferase